MTDENWIDVASVDDLSSDEMTLGVELADREVALFRVNGEVFATDGICTHGNARLCDGFIDGYDIECPLHQGKFDVRTGAATCAPATQALRTHAVKVDTGRIFVKLKG